MFIIFVVMAAVGATVFFYEKSMKKKADESYEELANKVNTADSSNSVSDDTLDSAEEIIEEPEKKDVLEERGITVPEKNLDWKELHETNEDIYAWIYVSNTKVDYPVVQHPTDNNFYLRHNLDGTKGRAGCIYTEDYNSKDFNDIHTVIYGHNFDDGTMFSSLHDFRNDDLFNDDNYIFIYTEDYVYVYQIFAAYEYNAIHLLDNFDYTNEYVYEDYLGKIYQTNDRVANVRQDIEVTIDDKILTLSTCTRDHDKSLRFLVTGVLINPREQVLDGD